MPATIRLQSEDFDAAAEARRLAAGRTDVGAVVTFTGICRGTEAGAPVDDAVFRHRARGSRSPTGYPPVIGGKKAISRAPAMAVVALTWARSMAARITLGLSKA